MLNLDTHILIYLWDGSLDRAEERLLKREPWGISAIVLWELYNLSRLGRLEFDLEQESLGADLGALRIWALSIPVCRQLHRLDFRSDPADEIIAATSLAHNARLVTRDTRILASKVVPLAVR